VAHTALLDRLREHLDRARLFRRPGTAILAVSGGADSVALLDLFASLAPERSLQLVVAHVDHGIQRDSRTVAQMVGDLARRYRAGFELGELHLGADATETGARHARYAWLRELRRRTAARWIVTAHHADDQVETVLLRVLRGSAPAGLAGMRPRARGGLVRPLLAFTRADLAAHVAARGLPRHDDPANRDPRHLRSWVRTELLPLLVARLGERVTADLKRAGRFAALDRRAWDAALELVPDLGLHATDGAFDVARASLGRYDASLSVALLRTAARRAGLVLGPDRARRLLDLATRPSGRRIELGGGWIAEVAFERLRVTRGFACAAERIVASSEQGSGIFGSFLVDWRPEPAPRALDRSGWTTWVPADAPWEVRAPQAGDRLVPLGGIGHRPLRRLLMEARVPRGARGAYPVVARGETILWVPGICRTADGLPDPGTPAVRLDVTEHGAAEADRRA